MDGATTKDRCRSLVLTGHELLTITDGRSRYAAVVQNQCWRLVGSTGQALEKQMQDRTNDERVNEMQYGSQVVGMYASLPSQTSSSPCQERKERSPLRWRKKEAKTITINISQRMDKDT